MITNQHVVPSEWAMRRGAAFRTIWFASLAANVGAVAHDALHHLSRLDRADADDNDPARIPGGFACRGARRHHEPSPPVARHPGSDPARRRTLPPDLHRAHERDLAARLHLHALTITLKKTKEPRSFLPLHWLFPSRR